MYEMNKLNQIVLDSLPYWAMVIEVKTRTILAANKLAVDRGAKIDCQCWDKFWHQQFISEEHKRIIDYEPDQKRYKKIKCDFCQADEAIGSGLPTRKEVEIEGTICEIWWVPVDKDIYLHYAKDITERKKAEDRTDKLNRLNEKLLISNNLKDKLKLITENVVKIFDADFARIWIIQPGDLCESECQHAKVTEGPHVCLHREGCLHLLASSGRYTHIDGGHRRVPFGCYKIGKIAAALEPKFLTNDVINDPRVHDHEWAKKLGLVSFAGYRLLSGEGEVIGVLALFCDRMISPEEDFLMENLAVTTAQIIQTATAENALRKSEEKFKLLAEHSADVIYKVNIESERYTYASPSIKKIFGYSVEETLSLKARDTLTIDSYTKQRESLAEALMRDRKDPSIMEVDVLHKDGHTLPVEIHATFISDNQGNPAEILGIARDITKRKQVEIEREKLINDLQQALKEIKTLRGILPICSYCKKIRDDEGYWEQVDVYIDKYSQADVSHGICPECAKKHYPEFDIYKD